MVGWILPQQAMGRRRSGPFRGPIGVILADVPAISEANNVVAARQPVALHGAARAAEHEVEGERQGVLRVVLVRSDEVGYEEASPTFVEDVEVRQVVVHAAAGR